MNNFILGYFIGIIFMYIISKTKEERMIIYNAKTWCIENNGKNIFLNAKENEVVKLLIKGIPVDVEVLKKYYENPIIKISRLKKKTGLNIKSKYGRGYYVDDLWIDW